MAKREIWHEIIIKCSLNALFEAVTRPKKIAHWWTNDVRGESVVGKNLEIWFDDFCQVIAVTKLQPGQLVQWHVTDKGLPDWADTKVEFKMFTEEGKTFLHFRHSDWRENAATFPHCSMGWAIFLISLKEFLETGKGRPFPYDLPINLWTPPVPGGARDVA